jgi:hypothetical protein
MSLWSMMMGQLSSSGLVGCTRHGGGGTSHYQLMRWWSWPLPPSGPLEFIYQLGTSQARIGIDVQFILDAAQRSIRVWPEGEA